METWAIISLLIVLQITSIASSVLNYKSFKKFNADSNGSKQMAAMEKELDRMQGKYDQMRLTMTDAVDKVEMFGKRWIKRDRDGQNGPATTRMGTPEPDKSVRLARLNQKIRGG